MDHLESAWTPKVRHRPRQVSPTSDVGHKSGHSQATCTLDQLATNSGAPSTLLRLDNSLEWLKKALYLELHGYKVYLGFSIRSQTNFLANPILHLHHEVYRSGQTDTHSKVLEDPELRSCALFPWSKGTLSSSYSGMYTDQEQRLGWLKAPILILK